MGSAMNMGGPWMQGPWTNCSIYAVSHPTRREKWPWSHESLSPQWLEIVVWVLGRHELSSSVGLWKGAVAVRTVSSGAGCLPEIVGNNIQKIHWVADSLETEPMWPLWQCELLMQLTMTPELPFLELYSTRTLKNTNQGHSIQDSYSSWCKKKKIRVS